MTIKLSKDGIYCQREVSTAKSSLPFASETATEKLCIHRYTVTDFSDLNIKLIKHYAF